MHKCVSMRMLFGLRSNLCLVNVRFLFCIPLCLSLFQVKPCSGAALPLKGLNSSEVLPCAV